VANKRPDKIDETMSTGTDQVVTPISLPNIGFSIMAVGIAMIMYVAALVIAAITHLFKDHRLKELKQTGNI
jgi:hypothetical protein